MLTPDDIIFNKIVLTDINFFNLTAGKTGTITTIREQIAMWYYIMMIIAIAVSLIVLLIDAIRMAITTIASEKAIYKKALKDWITSVALIFVLHYLIRAIIWLNEVLVNMIGSVGLNSLDEQMDSLAGLFFDANLYVGLASIFIYVMITVYSLMFLITYIKRMLVLAFLIIISPLITITYSIDKMGDQKAQALNSWMKEFVYNVLIQPFHCILYLVFVNTAIAAVGTGSVGGLLLALLSMKFVWDGEKIVRKIFGFEESSVGTVAASSALLGAAIAKARTAGSNVKSGVKFAQNTKTGQLLKQKYSDKKAERKDLKGLTRDDKKDYKAAKKSKDTEKMEQYKEKAKENRSEKEKQREEKRKHMPIHKMADSAKNRLNNSNSKLIKTARNIKNSEFAQELGQAIKTDAKRYGRKLVTNAPKNIIGVTGGIMAAAATYALPDQNLFTAVGAGYAAGKSLSTGTRNFMERRKENFEDNVLNAWKSHCAINNIPPEKRSKESFEDWYSNIYSKGKNMKAYSTENMNDEKKLSNKELDKIGIKDDGEQKEIYARLERAILNKEDYDPQKLFAGFNVDPNIIAGAVAGYASKFNESYVFEQESAYDQQMENFGIDYTDALSGISESQISNVGQTTTQDTSQHSEQHIETTDEVTEQTIEQIEQDYGESLREEFDGVTEADSDEMIRHLETLVEQKILDIERDIQSLDTNLQNDLRNIGIDSTQISQIESDVRSQIESGVRDIETIISNLQIPENAKDTVRDYANNYVEKYTETEKQREILQITDRQTLRTEIVKMVRGNNEEQ